jgi:ABC-type Fe3+/spermidine/putrescine transport system ATPase subunit
MRGVKAACGRFSNARRAGATLGATAGPPEQIYRQPENLFVARFTGSAGEFPSRVVEVSHGHVDVRVGGTTLRARHKGTLAPGAQVSLLVRPAATPVLAEAADGEATLTGTVVDVAYRGCGYDHVVACAGGTLSSVFDPNRWPRGASLRIRLDPEGCVAYADGCSRAGLSWRRGPQTPASVSRS